MVRRRSNKQDTGIWPFRNRMEGTFCAHCGKVITGTESRPGEIKAWQRIRGKSSNWHLLCALQLGKVVNRAAYEKILSENPDLERIELPVEPRVRVNPVVEESFHPAEPPMVSETEILGDDDPELEQDDPAPPKVPDWLQGMADAILPYVETRIDIKTNKVEKLVERALDKIQRQNVTRIEVIEPKTMEVRNLGIQHRMFPKLFSAVQAVGASGKRNMVMLVGPTGSGKTTAAEETDKALKVPYYHFGAMDTEYKMLGFIDAQGRIVSTEFRKWYLETGGLALFDEMDSWFPNAQLSLNSLTNGYMTFPDGQHAGHANRYMVSACNTWGLGADNDYVGRFKLDAAFLNRWNVKLHWDYDEDLERGIFGNDRWTRRVQELRARCRQKGIKTIISPRASDTGYGLLDAGWAIEEVEECVVRQGMKDSDWQSILHPRCN